MKALTIRQRFYLGVIRSWVLEKGWPPTLLELAEAGGVKSTNGVSDVLEVLVREGYLTRVVGQFRSMRLTGAGERACVQP